jgi:septum site-determining protein MinC
MEEKKTPTVTFKGNGKGFTVLIDSAAPFDSVKNALFHKLELGKAFFSEGVTRISFKGRSLTKEEEEELKTIISENAGAEVRFEPIPVKKEPVQKKQRSPQPEKDITPTRQQSSDDGYYYGTKNPKFDDLLNASENITRFYHGSLRSGQKIYFNGSVIVAGDVNPGAEIIAEGNIIVLGALRGMAHAGCTGNEKCFAAALSLSPTQLRIGSKITYFPPDTFRNIIKKKKTANPSMAFIKDGRISVTELVYH